MKKLLMLAVAAMALAVPSSAMGATETDGSQFTHEGLPIEEGHVNALLEGTARFTTGGGGGVHCNHITFGVTLEAGGKGTVTSLATDTNCKANGVAPTHAEAEGLHTTTMWEVRSRNDETITIGKITIRNEVTHPEFPGVRIAENTLEGYVTAELDATGTTVTVKNDHAAETNETPMTVTRLFPEEGEEGAAVSGDLTITNGDNPGEHTHLGVTPAE